MQSYEKSGVGQKNSFLFRDAPLQFCLFLSKMRQDIVGFAIKKTAPLDREMLLLITLSCLL